MGDPEALREQLAEAPDAVRLGRVVPRRDEVDPGLPRVGHDVLLRLAGEERVVALRDRPWELARRAAGDDGDAPDGRRSAVEDQRLAAAAGGGDAPGELGERHRLGERAAASDAAER